LSIAIDNAGGIVKCCATAFILGRPRGRLLRSLRSLRDFPVDDIDSAM